MNRDFLKNVKQNKCICFNEAWLIYNENEAENEK